MDEIQLSKRIFFWTCFVIFWLVSATIIGYAFGYRFSFDKGIFIYGGSITIKTTPQAVNVYLDDILISSGTFSRLNNSYHINGIKPGEYFLEVKAPGYQTWSKKTAVHSGISTEFWNIVLTENSYKQTEYDSTGIERLFISPRKNLAAFTKQEGDNLVVKILNPDNAETLPLFSAEGYVFTDDEKENIEWSPQTHRLIIPAIKDGEKNYFIIRRDTGDTLQLKEVAQMDGFSHVRWDPKNKDVLFYMSGGNLWRLDLNSPQDKKLLFENIASYDFSPKGLFYMQLPEGIVYKTSFDGSDTARQITTKAPDDMSDNSYQIIVYDEDRVTFLNKRQELYIYNRGEEDSYFNKLSGSAKGLQFSDDGKKLLYWTDNEILTYFVRKWDVQPVRSENEIMSITRISDPIRLVQWTRDYEHILFATGNKLKMIEIDNRDHRNMTDVLSLSGTNSPIIKDNFTDGKLYFTDKNEAGQYVLRSIYFPEQTSFLQSLFVTEPAVDTTQHQ